MSKDSNSSICNAVISDIPCRNTTLSTAWNISHDDGNVIKGIAIIMMFFHHIYFSPRWYITPIEMPDYCLLLGKWCKFCVSIFAFLTGWFFAKGKNKSIGYCVKKSLRFYFCYMLVFFFCLMIAIAFCHWKPSIADICNELFPIGKEQLMIFCWYIAVYPVFLFVLSLCDTILRHTPKQFRSLFIIITLITCIYLTHTVGKRLEILGYLSPSGFFTWIGIVLAAYYLSSSKLFSCFCHYCQSSKFYLFLSFLFLAPILFHLWEHYAPSLIFHITFTPNCVHELSFLWGNGFQIVIVHTVYIVALMIFIKRHTWQKVRNILQFIGKFSMNLWFLHCLFFSIHTREVFQPLITFIPYPAIILFSLLLLCLPPAMLLQQIQRYTIKKLFRF